MKISLSQQLDEVERELRERKTVYERIAGSNPSRRSELDYFVKRLEAARDTLLWLQKNEDAIKQKMSH